MGERRPLVKEDLQWKTTFGGRQPLLEDDFWWNTILACRLVRFAALWKTDHWVHTRPPSMETSIIFSNCGLNLFKVIGMPHFSSKRMTKIHSYFL